MKNNIKIGLVSFSLVYIVIIVIFSIKSYINYQDTIIIGDNKELREEISVIKNNIDNLSNQDCKYYLNDLLSLIEDVNKITVKDYFNKVYLNGNNILSYYHKGIDACDGFNEDSAKKNDLPLLFITASVQDDEILQDYMFNYEFSLNDRLPRDVAYASLTSMELKIKNDTVLNIIEKIIELEKDSEVNNEN